MCRGRVAADDAAWRCGSAFSLQAFLPDGAPTPYVRASFSLASEADINTALERLSALLREQQQAK